MSKYRITHSTCRKSGETLWAVEKYDAETKEYGNVCKRSLLKRCNHGPGCPEWMVGAFYLYVLKKNLYNVFVLCLWGNLN